MNVKFAKFEDKFKQILQSLSMTQLSHILPTSTVQSKHIDLIWRYVIVWVPLNSSEWLGCHCYILLFMLYRRCVKDNSISSSQVDKQQKATDQDQDNQTD